MTKHKAPDGRVDYRPNPLNNQGRKARRGNMEIKELNFKPHPLGSGGTQARHMFSNGFGVSVVTGSMFYTGEGKPYEIAVITKDGITYETPITDDVLGYLSEKEANKILADVEALG